MAGFFLCALAVPGASGEDGIGSAGFRLALRFGSLWPRVLGARLCLVAVPASQHGSAAAGLLAIAAVIAATLAGERAAGSEDGVPANGTGAAS
jgi:hypothetical protein